MVADAELIRRVQTLVDELDARRGIAAHPAISLTDEPTSSARHGGPRRQPSIRISRGHAAGDPEILRGVVAHEYAHAVDARARRDIIVTLAGLLTAALAPFAIYTYAHLSGQHTWTSALSSPPAWPPPRAGSRSSRIAASCAPTGPPPSSSATPSRSAR
jgi:hypothetical protein